LRIQRGVEREGLPFLQHDLAFAEALDADLRTTEVQQDTDTPVRHTGRLAHQRQPAPAILHRAMGGVQADDVHTFPHHSDQHVQVIGRRPYGGDNLRSSQHKWSHTLHPKRVVLYHPRARSSSATTAGNGLPSTNSRNAPPPVEIYEMPSSTPYFSIAARVSP